MFKTLLLFSVLSVACYSQTKPDISQIKATSPTNVVYVVVPGVGIVPALLGPNLVLTNNSGVYTLNTVVPSAPTPVFVNNTTKVGATVTQSFSTTLPVTGGRNNLAVYRNGVLQTESEDYIALVNADNTITVNFLGNVVATTDLIRLRYF